MSENSKIEWTEHTFNPWWGCAKVSPGCDHCYAERDSGRFTPGRVLWGVDAERREFGDKHWTEPKRWNAAAAKAGRRARVFCASMADVFDKNAPTGARERLWRLIGETPNLDWLLLTKRIGNAEKMVPPSWLTGAWPANAWLGISVVNQEEADRDIPKLLAVPAAKQFLSIEPLLGPVNLNWIDDGFAHRDVPREEWRSVDDENSPPGLWWNVLTGQRTIMHGGSTGEWSRKDASIDWVIVGGESGPEARAMHPDWVTSLRDQCKAANVPFLFKQWGEWKPISQMDESEHNALYRSRVTAKGDENQRALDESYGRDCRVPAMVVHTDGSIHAITEPKAFLQGAGAMTTFKAGKKNNGRVLDGREWNGCPR